MAKICPKCGREYENRSMICRICGCELDEFSVRNQVDRATTNQVRPRYDKQKPVVVNIQEDEEEPYLVVEPHTGPSGLSITALVFSLLGCFSVVGLVLGIIDLYINKHRKKACSVLAIVFCGLWTIGMLAWAVAINGTKTPILANTGVTGQTGGYDSGNGTATKDTFGLMETAEMNNVQVTMTNYKESYGSDWNSPEDGNVFVLVEFDIVNNSNSDLAVSSVMSFDAYADGYSTSLSLGALVENNDSQLDGTIAGGKRMRGWIGYEVPTNWNSLEIHFTVDVWSSNKFEFVLGNSGVAQNNVQPQPNDSNFVGGIGQNNADDYLQSLDSVIYQDESIIITYIGISGEEDEYDFDIMVENLTNRSLEIQARETSVNGLMVDPWCSIEVAPNKSAIGGIGIKLDDAERNPKSSVTSAETKFHVIDWDDDNFGYDTQNIIIR